MKYTNPVDHVAKAIEEMPSHSARNVARIAIERDFTTACATTATTGSMRPVWVLHDRLYEAGVDIVITAGIPFTNCSALNVSTSNREGLYQMRDKLLKAWAAARCISSGVDAVHKVLSDAGIRPDLPSFEAQVRRVWDDTRSNTAVADCAMTFVPASEPVTWTFEVATTIEMDDNGNVIYGGWQARTGTVNPTAAPEGMVRNLKARTAQQSRDAECLDVLRALLLKAHVGTPASLKARAAAVIKVLEGDQ